MSSHHFVKEDQEPALLIIDPDAIPFERVQELLEWSPLVIVAEKAVEKVLGWGIKIDVLLTSPRGEAFRQIVMDQSPIQVLASCSENDLNEACEFLIDRKQINLNIIVADAQKYFMVAAKLLSKINIVLFDNTARWNFVRNGSYTKWLPAQTSIQAFVNGSIEKIDVGQTGVFRIERKEPFWIGESH